MPLLTQLTHTIEELKIADIIEVTYAYDILSKGKYFNKTLFTTFAGITRGDRTSQKRGYDEVHEKVYAKLDNAQHVLKAFQREIDAGDDQHLKQILQSSLDYNVMVLEFAKVGLPFEIEKTGTAIPFELKDYHERTHILKELEKKLFDGQVQDDDIEVNEAYVFFRQLIHFYSENLNDSELEEYTWYIEMVSKLPAFSLTKEEIQARCSPREEKSVMKRNAEIFSLEMKREDYVEVFKLALEFYDIHKPIVIDNRSSIYDGAKALHIPSDERYDEIKIGRVLSLLTHEIETHFIVEKNHRHTLKEVRGGRNLPKEEGLAILNENLLAEKPLQDLKISRGIAYTLMAELLPHNQYLRFLELHFKLLDQDYHKSSVSRMLRQKRNYPLSLCCGQHKDTTYARGARYIANALTHENSRYRDFYVAKVQFADIQASKQLAEGAKITMTYPKFLGERIKNELLDSSIHNFKTKLDNNYFFLTNEEKGYVLTLTKSEEEILEKLISLFKKYIK